LADTGLILLLCRSLKLPTADWYCRLSFGLTDDLIVNKYASAVFADDDLLP
jgi:hypothetical protein